MVIEGFQFYFYLHYVKSVQIRSFFWFTFSCIQSEYRKYGPEKHRIWTLFTQCRVRKVAERGKVWTQNFKHKRRAWNKVIAKSKKITISLSLSYKKHLCPFSLTKRQNCFKLSVVEFFFPNGIQVNMGFLKKHFWKF